MSTNSWGQVLDPEDLQILTREGTVIAGDKTGVRRIHKRRLNPSSEEEYKDLTLPSPLESVPGGSTVSSLDDFEIIPDHIISLETLDYLGFTDAAASVIWQRWSDFGNDKDTGREIDGGPVTFESMFRSYIQGNGIDTYSDNDDTWREAMDGAGIDKRLQDGIMTSSCRDIRLTECCKYWLLDTVSAKYASLGDIQMASRERAMASRRAASRPSALGSGSGSQRALLPGQIPSSSGGRSTSQIFDSVPGMSVVTASSPIACADVPGHTILYRGGFSKAIMRIFDEQGKVIGKKLAELQTTRTGDFNSTKAAVYMAVNFSVARKYAYWCKKREPGLASSTLRMEIPNAAIEALDNNESLRIYWPAEGWRQLVWQARKRVPLPHRFSKYARATLVIGTFLGKPTNAILNLATPDKITQRMLLPNDYGGFAVQYAFIDDQGVYFLAAHGTDKCIAHPLTRRDAEELEATMGQIAVGNI